MAGVVVGSAIPGLLGMDVLMCGSGHMSAAAYTSFGSLPVRVLPSP